MSTGGAIQRVTQAFLNGLTHDARYRWRFHMDQNQRNHWWENERALNPGRWFHFNGREIYRRGAVNHNAPLQFLLEMAMEIAHEAAYVARRAARMAEEATRNAAVAEIEAVGNRVSSSDSSSDSDNDSDSDSPEVIIINNSDSDSDSASDSD